MRTAAATAVPLQRRHGRCLDAVFARPQYKGLAELQEKYKRKGFEVLAFPCNQFGAQEPGACLAPALHCHPSVHDDRAGMALKPACAHDARYST